MRGCIIGVLTLFVLAATAMMCVQAASAQDIGKSPYGADQPVLKIMQIVSDETNESEEAGVERRIWNSFVENLDYQGELLNSTAQGNASNETIRDVMLATTALLVLNSQALAEAESITPDQKYEEFHGYTINAMKYFNIYLYNMAKLFETRKSKYSNTGREALNLSLEYYNLGKAEAEFLF